MTQDMQAAASVAALPQYCYAVVPEKPAGQRIVIIKAREGGCYQTNLDAANLPGDEIRAIVERLNTSLGISPAQAQAMLVGSLFGWHTIGANPSTYSKTLH